MTEHGQLEVGDGTERCVCGHDNGEHTIDGVCEAGEAPCGCVRFTPEPVTVSTTTRYDSEEAWLAARAEGIGASEAAAVLGVSPFESALGVWARKVGLDTTRPDTPQLRFGRLLEPLIANEYMRETLRVLHDPGRYTLVRGADPWMFATLDRVITVAEDRPVPAPLEIKSTGYLLRREWDEEPPLHVQVQVQHQLAVTGWPWASVCVLIGGSQLLWCDVERNDEFIALLRDRLQAFWRRVQAQDPPPPVAQDKDVLALIHPKDSGATITLPGAALGWDAQRQEAITQLEHWQTVRDEAESRLKGAIGEASVGLLTSGVRYSWRAVPRAEYMVPASTTRRLKRFER